jgi:hypothetical protein
MEAEKACVNKGGRGGKYTGSERGDRSLLALYRHVSSAALPAPVLIVFIMLSSSMHLLYLRTYSLHNGVV